MSDHGDQLRLPWEAFESEFRRLWPTRVGTFFDDACLDRFLRRVWTESLGYAGTEVIRRIIGFAHLTDLTDLTTLGDPVPASCRALLIGRELTVRRDGLNDPNSVRAVVHSQAEGRGAVSICGSAVWARSTPKHPQTTCNEPAYERGGSVGMEPPLPVVAGPGAEGAALVRSGPVRGVAEPCAEGGSSGENLPRRDRGHFLSSRSWTFARTSSVARPRIVSVVRRRSTSSGVSAHSLSRA